MTVVQLLMLATAAFFAYKIYEHVERLEDVEENVDKQQPAQNTQQESVEQLIEEADEKLHNGDFVRALTIYSEANYKKQNDPDILFKMGYALMQQDRDDEALEYLQDAVQLDTNNIYIHQALASVYRKLKEYEKAKEHLNIALALQSSNPVTYYNYGNVLVDMQEYQEAIQMYQKALELDPSLTQAQEELEKLQEKV